MNSQKRPHLEQRVGPVVRLKVGSSNPQRVGLPVPWSRSRGPSPRRSPPATPPGETGHGPRRVGGLRLTRPLPSTYTMSKRSIGNPWVRVPGVTVSSTLGGDKWTGVRKERENSDGPNRTWDVPTRHSGVVGVTSRRGVLRKKVGLREYPRRGRLRMILGTRVSVGRLSRH